MSITFENWPTMLDPYVPMALHMARQELIAEQVQLENKVNAKQAWILSRAGANIRKLVKQETTAQIACIRAYAVQKRVAYLNNLYSADGIHIPTAGKSTEEQAKNLRTWIEKRQQQSKESKINAPVATSPANTAVVATSAQPSADIVTLMTAVKDTNRSCELMIGAFSALQQMHEQTLTKIDKSLTTIDKSLTDISAQNDLVLEAVQQFDIVETPVVEMQPKPAAIPDIELHPPIKIASSTCSGLDFMPRFSRAEIELVTGQEPELPAAKEGIHIIDRYDVCVGHNWRQLVSRWHLTPAEAEWHDFIAFVWPRWCQIYKHTTGYKTVQIIGWSPKIESLQTLFYRLSLDRIVWIPCESSRDMADAAGKIRTGYGPLVVSFSNSSMGRFAPAVDRCDFLNIFVKAVTTFSTNTNEIVKWFMYDCFQGLVNEMIDARALLRDKIDKTQQCNGYTPVER